MKEPHTEIALQKGNVSANGGRRQRQMAGSFRKTAMLGATNKGFKVGQRFHGTIFKHMLKIMQALPD